MKTKNNNDMLKRVIYIIVGVVFILLCFYLFNVGDPGKQIQYSDFMTMIESDTQQVTDVYASGGIAYVRKEGSEINEKDFPKFADYYFTYDSSNSQLIAEKITLSNETKTYKINFTTEVKGESFLSKILPYLSIIVVLVIGVLIFKMMAGGNKSAMSFAKSRAKTGETSKVRFSDVAGAEEEKEELREVVEFLKNPQKFRDLGARIPKGVLLLGPPGTGKTLLAKAVAGESSVPFFSISGSDFVEMFVGVGAARVRDLFDTAKKNMPCIVFIDEIDAVGRQRGAGLGGGNDEREQTLNQLLVEMDGFEANDGIIVMAATNRSDVLDSALTRPGRFDRQIYVHIPDVKGRESIIKIHARNKPISEDVNFTTLARITSGFTGADLENMLNEAAILAARAGRTKIIMTDLTEGINKVIMGPQKKSALVTDRDRKITAYHESGHAILTKKLSNCDEVQEVSIIPRGMAGGYTMSRPDNDDRDITFNQLMDRIAMTMGGRIAEELIFGDVTTGASADIQNATDIARKMVTEWGMSDKLGFVSLGSSNEVFLGRDYQVQKTYSEKIAAEIDDEIKSITTKNYKRAQKILEENKSLLEEMAKLLLLKNTIYKDEVDMLMSGKKAEEIAKIMEEKEAEEKKKQDIARKEQELAKKNKEIEIKIKTAEVLARAGVISQDELDDVKKSAEGKVELKTDEKPKVTKVKKEKTGVESKIKNTKKKTDDKGEKE